MSDLLSWCMCKLSFSAKLFFKAVPVAGELRPSMLAPPVPSHFEAGRLTEVAESDSEASARGGSLRPARGNSQALARYQ